jgi:hypothetical protein
MVVGLALATLLLYSFASHLLEAFNHQKRLQVPQAGGQQVRR